jgi:hypothetical protein
MRGKKEGRAGANGWSGNEVREEKRAGEKGKKESLIENRINKGKVRSGCIRWE